MFEHQTLLTGRSVFLCLVVKPFYFWGKREKGIQGTPRSSPLKNGWWERKTFAFPIGKVHPGKLTWNLKMEVWFRWFSFSNRWFSGSMLVFGGVTFQWQTVSFREGRCNIRQVAFIVATRCLIMSYHSKFLTTWPTRKTSLPYLCFVLPPKKRGGSLDHMKENMGWKSRVFFATKSFYSPIPTNGMIHDLRSSLHLWAIYHKI